jgi:hypothetical protein
MEPTARIFNCARCHRQVIICSCCDRGNSYCSPTCSAKSRKASVQAAGKRYQQTYQGKLKHAERQRRYRNKIVTHHTYQESPANDLLPPASNEAIIIIPRGDLCCHICGCSCKKLLRTSFLHRTSIVTPGVWPLGP